MHLSSSSTINIVWQSLSLVSSKVVKRMWENVVRKRDRKNNRTHYPATRYQSAGAHSDPPDCIPLKEYCAKYFLSKSQVLRLLSKRVLCAVTLKKRTFIIDKQPENEWAPLIISLPRHDNRIGSTNRNKCLANPYSPTFSVPAQPKQLPKSSS